MPTPTERHLEVIAEKIEIIKNLQQAPAGAIPTDDIQAITAELQAIGEVVFLLPESFTDKYSDVPWGEMKNWTSSNTFVSGTTSEQLTDMICDLNKAGPEIRRHIERDNGIQERAIESLNATYEQYSKEWYAHIQTPYLLVSITVIFFLFRIEISDLDIPYSNWQISFYLIHLLYTVAVVFEIQLISKLPQLQIFDRGDALTITEFFDTRIRELEREISEADRLLKKRTNRRLIFNLYWLASLMLSIIITAINAASTSLGT